MWLAAHPLQPGTHKDRHRVHSGATKNARALRTSWHSQGVNTSGSQLDEDEGKREKAAGRKCGVNDRQLTYPEDFVWLAAATSIAAGPTRLENARACHRSIESLRLAFSVH